VIETVLELALGNVIISTALAFLAYAVHRSGRYPAAAHALWVLVLVKAVTPPLLVLSVPAVSVGGEGPVSAGGITAVAGASGASGSPLEALASVAAEHGAAILLMAWLAGGIIVALVSARRIHRFGRLLSATSTTAPPAVERLAASVGFELGMRATPPVYVTSARISPMTWWTRGRARLILPLSLLQQVDGAELRWVLAHELAHVKRRDHFVRWLEWLACVAFWWNPVVWWARRNLRLDEEDACDAFVLAHVEGASRAYAGTLLTVVEVLARPRGHVPAMATGIDAASSLEHRLSTIISTDPRRRAPRPLVAGITVVAVAAMALGFGSSDGTPEEAATAPRGATADAIAVPASIEGSPDQEVTRYATVSSSLPAGATLESGTYVGSAGSDAFAGTAAGETIYGYAGADDLRGGGGADIIRGGAGRDTIRGGAGRDELVGGAGADIIRGGAGRDTVVAGAGDDTVYVWADGTPDLVDCGEGTDRAVIDSTDSARYCETVEVRDPA
jgi:beta-lactamase regulating signal transducer with metallopeptidase domain